MKNNRGTFIVSAFLLTFIFISCASTELITSWKDDTYSGNVKNVLVIVITEKKAVRRVLERVYAMQFKGYGVNAVPSHEILPDEKMLNKDTILSKIEDMGIDSVLLTRLVSRDEVTTDITRIITGAPIRMILSTSRPFCTKSKTKRPSGQSFRRRPFLKGRAVSRRCSHSLRPY